MQIFYPIFIFCLGLCAGSFLNVVIYRLPKGEKISGRSCCPRCKKTIAWYDLIPVFSFLALFGRCRYCRQKISLRYPLVEITTALLFLLIFNYQFSIFSPGANPPLADNEFSIFNFQFLTILYHLIIASFLIAIFFIDLRHYIIPDKIVLPAIAIALIFNFQFLIFNQFSIINYSILSGLGGAVFFLAIVLISHGRWMGTGDIKLAFLMGLFLGFPKILPALFLSFLLGGIMGIGLIILGRKNLKSEIPFGPFLVAGTFIALFWGQNLINWYLSLI